MTFVYVTGNSGVGKSAICQELKTRGFDAHDGDDDGISVFVNLKTGLLSEVGEVEELTPDFFRTHKYCLAPEPLKRLANVAKERLVFLCGGAGGSSEKEQLEVFDGIVYLTIDEETIRRRIANRSENPFGKSEEQLKAILRWQKYADEYFGNTGAHKIDARQPLNQVVQEVIAFAESLGDEIT